MKKKFYITTAIAYTNSYPHCGHALEIIQADAIARFHKLLGKDVFFQTGTDEHGIKNWQTAKEKGKNIMDLLDENAAVFKKMYKLLGIEYDQFIRTTDKKLHYPGAKKLWEELVKAGDIYKKKYCGLYCSGCESFKTEKELIEGKCPDHPTRDIEEVEEENYFFQLSKYKEKVMTLIKKDHYKIIPETRKNEILSWLKGAKDISFSRPKSSLPWGIPVPGDDEHVMYVWCDALSNYITGAGYGRDEENFESLWPADIHVIGKDILRFHAAFWPAMLLSAGIDVPKELFVHGWVLSKGQKMSKSTGNVIEPFEQIKRYGVEPFRFYLLGSMPIDSDGDYTEKLAVERINNELVGNLSNFCYRVLSFTAKNYESEIIGIDNDEVVKEIEIKFDLIKDLYENFDFRKVIEEILAVSDLGNQYFQKKEPWKNIDEGRDVLGTCVNIAKNLAILTEPIMPGLAKKLRKQLNLGKLKWDDLGFDINNHKIGKPEMLVRKVEDPNVSEKNVKKFRKVKLTIDKCVKELGINAVSVCIKGVKVKKNHAGLKKLKKEEASKTKVNEKIIKAYENIYDKAGVKAECPLRRLIGFVEKSGAVPTINTVVDSYNVVSAKYNLTVGCHDINKLEGNAKFVILKGGEKFKPMGSKEEISLDKKEYACADDKRVICRLDIKQCDETKIDENTSNIFLYVQGNEEVSLDVLKKALKEICDNIVMFCGGEVQ